FIVMATQNPIEQEGTYPLPEAQLDRFLFKLDVTFPSQDEEAAIVRLHGNRTGMPKLSAFDVAPVANAEALGQARALVGRLTLSDPIVDYIVAIVRATRSHAAITHGASPRAGSMLAMASRAKAAVAGRDFVIPDDVKELVFPTMRHRLVIAPSAEIEGRRADDILRQIVEATPAPR
ncbi:MAG: MoxR family ATPase, partial [Myxococcales bacterium]|nr:MoxR family ATPase [Myxococcales bacterium]